MNLNNSLIYRTREVISVAWDIFSRKVGNQVLVINKEASMQLQYAYILQQMLPLIIIKSDESLKLELETSIYDGDRNREVDIFITGYDGVKEFNIALELKCYKKIASSGGNRGATDIFMKDVYEDLYLLEKYCKQDNVYIGISLVMVDYENFINPKKKTSKCWDYDISNGTKIIAAKKLNTPIGGKPVDIVLEKKYEFNWQKVGEFWFLELEGK